MALVRAVGCRCGTSQHALLAFNLDARCGMPQDSALLPSWELTPYLAAFTTRILAILVHIFFTIRKHLRA